MISHEVLVPHVRPIDVMPVNEDDKMDMGYDQPGIGQ